MKNNVKAPKKRIVIVEDEAIVAMDIELSLKHLGYEVVGVACEGSEALTIIENKKPDLILMDIQIKGKKSGIDIAAEVNKRFKLPVIFLTAYADSSTLSRAKESEPFAYIIKPFDEQELHTAIEIALRKHSAIAKEDKKIKDALNLSEEVFKLFVDAVDDYAIFVMSPSGEVMTWNIGAKKIFGYEISDVIGKDFLVFFVKDGHNLISKRIIAEVNRDGKVDHEGWLLNKDGQSFWAHLTVNKIQNLAGQIIGFGCVVRDLSTVRARELELRQAKEEAEAANLSKSSFLANMSHEIRTPLGIVIGFSELIADQTISSSSRANFMAAIRRNGELLSKVINDILDISKVEAGRLDIESRQATLDDILGDIRLPLLMKAQEKGLNLTYSYAGYIPESIITDPHRLRQILYNVIGNAIKFTNKGNVDVVIKYNPTKNGESKLEVLVRDTGQGIAKDKVSKLFAPFSQVDSSLVRKYGGVGLGLDLSRKMARLLGGDVQLVSTELGKGSTFSITVNAGPVANLANVSSSVVHTTEGMALRLKNLRILLVEDSTDMQYLVSRILKMEGASVELASNGAEALAKVEKEAFDILVMDIQMPVMDGYEATSKLRSQGFRAPIIALTAHSMVEEKAKCLTSGFNEHISKPVKKEFLVQKIADLAKSQPAFN